MYIARVVGDVIATHRHANLGGHKLLLVRRLGLDGREVGNEVIALDVVGVGIGERVLIVQEGNAARTLFRSEKIPVQAVVAGVVDSIELADSSQGTVAS